MAREIDHLHSSAVDQDSGAVDQDPYEQAFDAQRAPRTQPPPSEPLALGEDARSELGGDAGAELAEDASETAPGQPGPAGSAASPSVDDVMDALSNVIDPELGLDFVELGLIYGVEIEDGNVHVTFTLTTPGCPIGPQVSEQIDEFVGELDGVRNVTSEMVFTPPWSPEKMSEDAKFALGF
jgi:metal-sulfur cluster biosynthetic enzyme